MGFWIYFVSMTRLCLQIKSKLIFLTATPVHPAGSLESQLCSLEGWCQTRVRLPAGGQSGFNQQQEGSKQVPAWLRPRRGELNKQPILFSRRRNDRIWMSQVLMGKTNRPVWMYNTGFSPMEVYGSDHKSLRGLWDSCDSRYPSRDWLSFLLLRSAGATSHPVSILCLLLSSKRIALTGSLHWRK